MSEKDTARKLYERGATHFDSGELEQALPLFDEALQLDPSSAQAHNGRGVVLFSQSELESAMAHFDESIRLEPDFFKPYSNRGSLFHSKGEYDRALVEFNEAIRLNPDFDVAFQERGICLFDMQKYKEAIKDFTRFLELNAGSAWAFAMRGLAYHHLAETDAAIAEYDEAIRLDAGYADAYLNRGHCFIVIKQYEKSIEDFSHYIEFGEENADVYGDRGYAYQLLGETDAAISDFDQSIELDATSAWAFNCRGCAHYKVEDFDTAIKDYEEAIRLDPDYANAYLNRGRAFHEIEEFDLAVSDFDKSLSLEAENIDSFYYRAKTRWEMSELQKAIDDLTEAIRLNPKFRRAYKKRSRIWDELGESEKAEQDLDRADELSNDETNQGNSMNNRKILVSQLLEKHFAPTPLDNIIITERRFPERVRADLQEAIDSLVAEQSQLLHFCGVRKQHRHEGVNFSELLLQDRHDPALSVPPQYEEIDVGEDETVRCLKDGLWLLEEDGQKYALFLEPPSQIGRMTGIRFQVATVNNESGTKISGTFFKRLEKAIFESACYRGKILSLEQQNDYMGVSTGITVHKLKTIDREQVILPRKTLELLERNVIQFVAQRGRLNELGISTKKGLLFYGPPGTGKTHTIHFLAGALEGHTTLLISAEQVSMLSEYMTLARLLQPSIVVLEDVDLIARERTTMNGGCEEVLLNKLLNEMDGLKQDADILFILTTNRPETLESALASRPGRIDQAIEFPLPDEEGRAKLIRLYSYGVTVSDDVVKNTVKKTENVSAAFIKELMRRSMQFHLERESSSTIEMQDVENAIGELLFSGGSLNRKLLGAGFDGQGGDE